MAENDELKRIEQDVSKEEKKIEEEIKKEETEIKKEEEKINLLKEEKKIEEEIKKEEVQVKKEETEVKKEEEKINLLKEESEKLEHIKEEVSKKKVSEIEIELNLSGFKTFGKAAYDVLIKKKVLFYLLLILAVTVGWYVHTASIPALLNPLQQNSPLIGNNYLGMGGSLSGLDPYTFYIQMQNILKTGNVPVINHLEYLPIGLLSRTDELMVSFFGAYSARLIDPIVKGAVPMTSFMFLPAFFAIFSALLLFLIALEVFGDYWIASISAFILPAFITFLSRSTAGFTQKTSLGFMFILLAIFFLSKSLKSKRARSKMIYGLATGIATGLATAASGYSEYLILVIPIIYIIIVLLGYAKKGDMLAYLLFAIWVPIKVSFVMFTFSDVIHSALYYPMLFSYVLVIFKLIIYDRYRHKLKIPTINNGFSVAIYSIVISLVLVALTGLNTLKHAFSRVASEFIHPLGVGIVNPVTQTIAEYAPLDLVQRAQDFNFLVGSLGINFLLFCAGAVFLLYIVLKRFKHWYIPFLLSVPFILMINGGTFSYNAISYSFLFIFLALDFIPLGYIFLHKNEIESKRLLSLVLFLTLISLIMLIVIWNMDSSVNNYKYGAVALAVILILEFAFDKQEDVSLLSLLAIIPFFFFLVTVILSNVESRLLEPTELVAAIIIPFAIVYFFGGTINITNRFFKNSPKNMAIVSAVIIIIAIALVAVDLHSSLSLSYQTAQSSGSGLLLWGPTMQWISQNTPTNTSIISWWDYGYWEEAIANRTAVADGSNAYGYQSMIAKYFFEATSPYIYSTYLHYIHQPTYAVISGSEVEKFSAISTIALKPTSFTPMAETNITINSQNIGNESYKYLLEFGNVNGQIAPLYSNATISGLPGNANNDLLVEVLIPLNASSNGAITSIGNLYGIIYSTLTAQFSKPLPLDYNCVYSVGCKEVTNKGIPGGVMLLNATNSVNLHIGGFPQAPGGYEALPINMSQFGNGPALLYMPNETLDTLFDKLYLLNESIPGFKLLYTDNLPVNSLLSIENQVLTNVNVYQINYTALSKYMLTGECSISPSAENYCDNLSYLPAVFANYSKLINNTPINES